MNRNTFLASFAAIGLIAALSSPSQALLPTGAHHAQPHGSDADDSIAAWATHCNYVEKANLDPIGHHGTGGSEHKHVFFGGLSKTDFDNGVDNTLTNDDLRDLVANGSPAYYCNPPDEAGCDPDCVDGSLYWFPALYMNAADRTNHNEINPAYMLSYYRNEDVDPRDVNPGNMHPLPDNLSMVGGDHDATSGQGTDIVEWSCVQGDALNNGHVTNVQDTIPSSCTYDDRLGNSYLRVIVEFPNCIDDNLDNDDAFHNYTSDMEYALANPDYQPDPNLPDYSPWPKVCDTGYYPIPQVAVGVRWRLNGSGNPWGCTANSPTLTNHFFTCDTSDANLASDPDAYSHGVTAHADFMNGWTTADMEHLMETCFYAYAADHPDTDYNINCGVV